MRKLIAVALSLLLLPSIVIIPSFLPLSASQAQSPEPQVDPQPEVTTGPTAEAPKWEDPNDPDVLARGYVYRHIDRMPKDVFDDKYQAQCRTWKIEPYTDRCVAEIMKRSVSKHR